MRVRECGKPSCSPPRPPDARDLGRLQPIQSSGCSKGPHLSYPPGGRSMDDGAKNRVHDDSGDTSVPVPSVDGSLGTKLLPFVLSVIAGSADVIGFLGLGGLFIAHITGNLVILAARLVAGEQAPVAQ